MWYNIPKGNNVTLSGKSPEAKLAKIDTRPGQEALKTGVYENWTTYLVIASEKLIRGKRRLGQYRTISDQPGSANSDDI